jgi:hypothetical protein
MTKPLPKHMQPKLDIIGQRFGKLVVESLESNGKKRGSYPKFKCKCDCGKYTYLSRSTLRSGNTKSCGCGYWETRKKATDAMKKVKTKEDGYAYVTSIVCTYRHAAKARNLEFNLSHDDIANIVFKNCEYCGMEPSNWTKSMEKRCSSTRKHNGIDRKDNNLGYTIDNCVPCCYTCNRAKYTKSYDDFKLWIKMLVNRNKHLLD